MAFIKKRYWQWIFIIGMVSILYAILLLYVLRVYIFVPLNLSLFLPGACYVFLRLTCAVISAWYARKDWLDTISGHFGACSGSKIHNHVPIYVSYRFHRLHETARKLLVIKEIWIGLHGAPEAFMEKKKVYQLSLGLNPIYDTQPD